MSRRKLKKERGNMALTKYQNFCYRFLGKKSSRSTQNEYINLKPLAKGLEFLNCVVHGVYEELGAASS